MKCGLQELRKRSLGTVTAVDSEGVRYRRETAWVSIGVMLGMLPLVVVVSLTASRPAVRAGAMRPHQLDRRTAVEPHHLDRRTAVRTALAATTAVTVAAPRADAVNGESTMVWVPKGTVKVVKTSYQPTFITYLSRFLLNYDKSSANWWRSQLRDLPLNLKREQLSSIRKQQFGQFSESVEVGLQRYEGKAGVRSLFSFLRTRYGTTAQAKLQLTLPFSIISSSNCM